MDGHRTPFAKILPMGDYSLNGELYLSDFVRLQMFDVFLLFTEALNVRATFGL